MTLFICRCHLPLRGKLGWMTPRAGVKTTLAMERAFSGSRSQAGAHFFCFAPRSESKANISDDVPTHHGAMFRAMFRATWRRSRNEGFRLCSGRPLGRPGALVGARRHSAALVGTSLALVGARWHPLDMGARLTRDGPKPGPYTSKAKRSGPPSWLSIIHSTSYSLSATRTGE